MLKTAIILAGGFGTRLQSVVSDVPKPMAPVNGKPFLYWLLQYCEAQGLEKVILSTGYKGEIIEKYFGDSFNGLTIKYFKEEEPLGTGGAIKAALSKATDEEVFILNGDTFFNIDLKRFHELHQQNKSKLSLALKEMQNFDRYGVVKTDSANRINAFEEKRWMERDNINGGVYILNSGVLEEKDLPAKFSFEKDFLEKYLDDERIHGFIFHDYFIDIGIPEDYERVQHQLAKLPVNKEWTVFLDRDGVINRKIENGYVQNLSMFEWIPGAIEAIKQLSQLFGRVIIVTNQQGVGKGLMTEQDVRSVHDFIVAEVSAAGGRIDRIYFSPYLKSENHSTRKPDIGMALAAKHDFPEIDFTKSVIIGDSASDMQFGEKAGMKKIFIGNKPILQQVGFSIDATFPSALEALCYFSKNK